MGTKLYEVTVRYYIEANSEADAEMIADVLHLIRDNCHYDIDRASGVWPDVANSIPFNGEEGYSETCGQIVERARYEDARASLIDSLSKEDKRCAS